MAQEDRRTSASSSLSPVDSAETILNSELTGWIQQMQSAMAKIYEQKHTPS